MSVTNYKCPACGAPIVFNPKLGGFKCEFCFTEHTEEALTAYLNAHNTADTSEPVEEHRTADTGTAEQGFAAYQCNNCGAEVVAGDTATASFCYYCHSPVILTDRMKGSFKPDCIIPFKIDKKAAIDLFITWARKRFFVPKDFTDTMQQEKITGMYLPYWQTDIHAKVDYHAIGLHVTHWSTQNKDYTKTETYQIDRTGHIEVQNMQKLAFSNIDEYLINGISPYNEEEIKPFSAGYLAGFFAEQYTEKKEAVIPQLIQKAKTITAALIRASVVCNSFQKEEDHTSYHEQACRHLLLPAWVLTYLYKGKTYVFAVNGQTGKMCGELPLRKGKALAVSILAGLGITSVLLLGGAFIW